MLTDWEQYQLKLNRIDEKDVESLTTDMKITFKDGTERRVCQIWSRCMGYLRPTTDYNVGKYSEYESRKTFSEEKTKMHLTSDDEGPDDAAQG